MEKNYRQQLLVDYTSSRWMERPVYNERESREHNVSFTGVYSFFFMIYQISECKCQINGHFTQEPSLLKWTWIFRSKWPITSISFLLEGPLPPVRTLILNDCTNIRTNNVVVVIMQLNKTETWSLNKVDVSAREAVAIAYSQPSLFMLTMWFMWFLDSHPLFGDE